MPPSPYGVPAAIEMMGSVAAPLLAGFSLTLLILIITNPDAFRWPGPVLVALAFAAVTLISVVQFTFWARSCTVTPDELKSWWPDLETEERRVVVRGEQLAHERARRTWSRRARWSYRLGIITLLLGMAIALIPPGHVTTARWIASSVVLLGLLFEVLWVIAAFGHNRGKNWSWAEWFSPTSPWKEPPKDLADS